MPFVTVEVQECKVCGHQWQPRNAGVPKYCPRCKSTNWQSGRKRPPMAQQRAAAAARRREEAEALLRAAGISVTAIEPLAVEKAARSLPRLATAPCSLPCDLHAVLESGDLETVIVTDARALAKATPHSFVAKASGWSMRNGSLPDSISDDDDLLMVPFEEWTEGLKAGLIVLVHLHMKDGSDKCTLKEWTGRTLKAKNPQFRQVEFFGPDVESAVALAVCVWRLGKELA